MPRSLYPLRSRRNAVVITLCDSLHCSEWKITLRWLNESRNRAAPWSSNSSKIITVSRCSLSRDAKKEGETKRKLRHESCSRCVRSLALLVPLLVVVILRSKQNGEQMVADLSSQRCVFLRQSCFGIARKKSF